jgi:hypothetical protein
VNTLPAQPFIFLLFLSAAILIVICFFAIRIRSRAKLIYEKKSRYHHIVVYEDGFIRTIKLGKSLEAGKQSRIDLRYPNNIIL